MVDHVAVPKVDRGQMVGDEDQGGLWSMRPTASWRWGRTRTVTKG